MDFETLSYVTTHNPFLSFKLQCAKHITSLSELEIKKKPQTIIEMKNTETENLGLVEFLNSQFQFFNKQNYIAIPNPNFLSIDVIFLFR